MAKVTLTMEDKTYDQGVGVEVEGRSSEPENGASLANLVCMYIAEKWDDIVAAARAHALTTFAAELKKRDEQGEPGELRNDH